MLSLRALRCFVAVADHLNFTRAAANLNIAQPALTRTINQLEDRLGATLLIRDTRNVRLTEIGQLVLEEARKTLTQALRTERLGREMALGQTGRLKIGYTAFVVADPLAPLLRRFRVLKPSVRIELNNDPTEWQLPALLNATVDVALILGPISIPGILSCRIREEPLSVVMPRDHVLTHRAAITASDLHQVKLVVGSENQWSVYRRAIFSEFDRCGVLPRISQEAPTPEAIFWLVTADLGVTILPTSYARHLSQTYSGDLIAVRPFVMQKSNLSTICAWCKDNLNPVLPTFIQCLKEQLDQG
jgi:DNA-binding transcriptional LysR family regulator